ncbi:MAG: radical SAM protein [Methanotrichaceae archaeon]|nr:radical SAM protein [Methanotrichaceae archaeon]
MMHLRPSLLMAEVTTVCNLNCIMCPARYSGLEQAHMSNEVWSKIIKLTPYFQLIAVAGIGEPLTDPNFLSRIKSLDDLGVRTAFSTNGLLLQKFIPDLVALKHLAQLNVSIETPNADIYRYMRPGGALLTVFSGISALMKATTHPESVTASAVVMKSNLQSLLSLPAMLDVLGIKLLILRGLYNPGNLDEEVITDLLELENTLKKIETSCNKYGITLDAGALAGVQQKKEEQGLSSFIQRFKELLNPSPPITKQCIFPWEVPVVSKEGNVYACCSRVPDLIVGNILEQSFEEIWFGPKIESLRQDLLTGYLSGTCQSCNTFPSGPHPYTLYSSEVVDSQINKTRAKIVIKNTGRKTWKRGDVPGIYLSGSESWVRSDHICSFKEEKVSPNKTATFEFNPSEFPNLNRIRLVAEDFCWIPGTDILDFINKRCLV